MQKEGRFEEARDLYRESLEISKRLGDQQGIAATLHQVGVIAEHQGDMAEAARLIGESLSIFERLGSPYAEASRRALSRLESAA